MTGWVAECGQSGQRTGAAGDHDGVLGRWAGAFTLVASPRGLQTPTWYQVYGAPTHESPIRIQRPEGAVTQINRDAFGKPLSIVR